MVAVVEAYDELARRVLARPARLGRTRLVVVDGPSGAGKSCFADRLAAALAALPEGPAALSEGPAALSEGPAALSEGPTALPEAPTALPEGPAAAPGGARPPVVHTDDLLDGWADQFTFWPRLEERVLAPLRAGRPGSYQRYSWLRREFLPRLVPVPVTPVLIVEGVSAARRVVRPEATLAVLVTAPDELRLARAAARDGAEILPELRRWHAGEQAHFVADETASSVDIVVDGAPALPHDGRRYYVRRPRR